MGGVSMGGVCTVTGLRLVTLSRGCWWWGGAKGRRWSRGLVTFDPLPFMACRLRPVRRWRVVRLGRSRERVRGGGAGGPFRRAAVSSGWRVLKWRCDEAGLLSSCLTTGRRSGGEVCPVRQGRGVEVVSTERAGVTWCVRCPRFDGFHGWVGLMALGGVSLWSLSVDGVHCLEVSRGAWVGVGGGRY